MIWILYLITNLQYTMNNQPIVTNRIEYIDALRGFTMLLVVYSHLLIFGYGSLFLESSISFQGVIARFFMHLFFFISGFVFYKKKYIITVSTLFSFLKIKFISLIIPPIILGGVYVLLFEYSLYPLLLRETKGGYWFTISLFQFIIFYTVLNTLLQKLHITEKRKQILLIIATLGIYVLSTPSFSIQRLNINSEFAQLLGMIQWRFYPFFIAGILARKFYSRFQALLNNSYITGVIIILFFCFVLSESLIPNIAEGSNYHLFFLLSGGSGLILVFSYFYKYQSQFSKQTILGRFLQYIGKNTLEIYLLHYFFLPRNLHFIGDYFILNPSPVLELFISMLIVFMVIGVCLILSSVIQISDKLGCILFGKRI